MRATSSYQTAFPSGYSCLTAGSAFYRTMSTFMTPFLIFGSGGWYSKYRSLAKIGDSGTQAFPDHSPSRYFSSACSSLSPASSRLLDQTTPFFEFLVQWHLIFLILAEKSVFIRQYHLIKSMPKRAAAIINKEGALVQKADYHYLKHLKCKYIFVNYNFYFFCYH